MTRVKLGQSFIGSNITLSFPDATTATKGVTSTSRRKMLKRLAATLGTSLVVGTALVTLPAGKEAEAKLGANPTSVNHQLVMFVSPAWCC